MPTLLAIDPAASTSVSNTGWALFEVEEDRPVKLWSSGVVTGGFFGFAQDLDIQEKIAAVDIVVCEDYKVFNTFGDPSPLKIIGLVQYLRPDTVLQVPSGKNTAIPDAFLKEQGHWFTKNTGGGHHRDRVEAIRHGYYYLFKQKHIPTLMLLSPN